jgi:hypothetical protein
MSPGSPGNRTDTPQVVKPVIFVDLDGTLVSTWTPLITSSFMSQLFGLPICTPPRPKDGHLPHRKVSFPNGQYSLTCCRPYIRKFLRSLRAIGKVCMLTHASRDYAQRMNDAFNLGFREPEIFTISDDFENLSIRESIRRQLVVLIDDEGPGWRRRWLRRPIYGWYDHHAESRHRAKCHCLGITAGSRRDIPFPRFYGHNDDVFSSQSLRRSIVRRINSVLQRQSQKLIAVKAQRS